jgi:2-C-methyl-D-erythritol 4-phosphate cytidylyltransferase
VSAWAVLAAAGSGERLGSEHPKAFVRLGDQPLLAESLRRLDDSAWIDAIVVAAPPGWEEPAILLAEELGCSKVASCLTGGATRSDSVRLALTEVPQEAAVVLVHDAARPFLDESVIERVLTALNEGWDGAVPGLPLQDTVKRVEGERVAETLDRRALRLVQTPQAFAADVLRRALLQSSGGPGQWTDCSSAVEAVGGRVKLVPGDSRLLKITDAADLERAAALL